ncbi:zinc finger protein 280D isoform X1 [Canis lupus baileyi]|uniref:Zinc finger protein 280D n=5 Tax=Canis lupus TaxID=9612 RepID=A0A8C0Z7D3_CANLF|nr:zinc finger protein 280D isoform X1 [Canis lupus familiaris]XP_013964932.1 zinc finger protein 280D isoform X1 [Canis lupus familiaris]XP_013964933.1 zinc finger protein 280D isoform X1 [Canis lupus familiaris]XP_022268328.1 zinc finger protein 280D isoform X1 [Canis lupus familiaris]XP_025328474.1 zinc finger protein 280D isoform X1 [Canis lupus dingo]XP_025328475.1 zinc finger protein 280D isoform X1 [Canis lupus dingo]XP_025328476.1 zinc finger protein 280D isoform X1 [Canis lupus dingo|eukprot:XP_005638502.1 zinc finger protein 280D isoform X1 [Canis lupus familiaris]
MGDNPFQPKNNSKMAELFMECEEEELEPWQKKVKEVEDDDDDEPIFVGEISSSKPAISNILNRVNPSSYSRGIKNGALSRGITAAFKPTSQHYTNPTSNPVAASPVNFHPESRSSDSSVIVQPLSKPGYVTNSSRVVSNNSSELLFDLTQDTGSSHYQGGPTLSIPGMNESSFLSKRPSTSEVNSVNPKKPKPSDGISGLNSSAVFPSVKSLSVTSPQAMSSKGTNTSSNQSKNGTPFPRACPKCNIHFNLLDPLKNHMKYCCPDMINNFLGLAKTEFSSTVNKNKTVDSEKGKLIMLVNDFYYGKHEGDVQEEQKTHTTFKCFSCLKILKNNIRFMNHMKHHLELEKQSSESWENHTTCQHCYRQFPTPFQLQCHIESTHTPHEFSTICKICELSFETEHILLQHMKDNHKPGEMPYICQVCNYRSSSFSDVETHFRTSHENTKNLLCPFCLKVIKIATPYMHHYMKHQKKGIHRCTKCRLQFLTCKEKMDHKTQHHRTFIKPKQLEGLPPGTKVTIRASVGPLQSGSSPTPSISASTSTLQLSPPRTKNITAKNPTKSNTSKPNTTKSNTSKPNASKPNGSKSKYKSKISNMQKKQSTLASSNKKSKVNTALRNLRYRRGVHKCIECCSEIKDFANHFPTYVHCSFCRYNTSCSKAYVNHMMSFHSNRPSKRFCIFKKHSEDLRGITLVCLNCDFVADVSGLDNMATHLSQHETHTCQVVIEKVSVCIPTSEHLSELKNEAPTKEQEPVSEEIARPNMAEGEKETSNSESKQDKASEEEKNGCDTNSFEGSLATKSEESITVSNKENDTCLEDQKTGLKNIFSHDSNIDADKVEKEKQIEHICQKTELKMCQSSGNIISCDQIEDSNSSETRFSSKNIKDLRLTSADVSIDQFLRKRDEPESVSSDVSEQGSIHLEPLTPSEVLEYEATEILQKGSGDPSAKTDEVVSDQTDSVPGENSPSTKETTVDLADEKERS